VRTTRSAWVLAAALALTGCREREITSTERTQAAADVSEAEFAVTIKEYDRAEGLYAAAAKLAPDTGNIWVNLAVVRMRLHRSSDARDAYKSALTAYRQAFKHDPSDTTPVLREAYVLTILGKGDDARSLINDMRSKYPNDRTLQAFIDQKGIERMERDPGLKEIAP
jgi:cytochrome c-type biogenesis protein CcmH/NrfG